MANSFIDKVHAACQNANRNNVSAYNFSERLAKELKVGTDAVWRAMVIEGWVSSEARFMNTAWTK